MRTRPLYGRIGFWLREFSDVAEKDLSAILSTIVSLGGGSCLCLKVADGIDFVGSYDAKTPITSIADITAMKAACEAQNVTFLPVVVPRNLAGEAAMHGEIAQACGALMVDCEPYDGFFAGTAAEFLNYAQSLRAASGDAYLIAEPDPRSYGWSALGMDAAIHSFDAMAPQHYVGATVFQWIDMAAEIASFTQEETYGLDLYVTIYGADSAFPDTNTQPVQFWDLVRQTALGVCVFAMGPMNAAQLAAIKAMPAPIPIPDPIGPQPIPVPPVPPTPPTPVPPGPDYHKELIMLLKAVDTAVAALQQAVNAVTTEDFE